MFTPIHSKDYHSNKESTFKMEIFNILILYPLPNKFLTPKYLHQALLLGQPKLKPSHLQCSYSCPDVKILLILQGLAKRTPPLRSLPGASSEKMHLPGLPTSIAPFPSVWHACWFSWVTVRCLGSFSLPWLSSASTARLQACHTAGSQENSANCFNIYHHK